MNRKARRELEREIEELRDRLEIAEETLRAIQEGEVDALVVSSSQGEKVFTLESPDYPYRLFVEQMTEGAATLSCEGMLLYCNNRLASLVKKPLEQVIGANFQQFVAPSFQPMFELLLQSAQTGGGKGELHLLASDRTQIPVQVSISSLTMNELTVNCLIVTDLTEQKRNQEIVAAEKLARSILEQVAEAVIVCDQAGKIIRTSLAANQMCGENPIFKPFDLVFPLQFSNSPGQNHTELHSKIIVETDTEKKGRSHAENKYKPSTRNLFAIANVLNGDIFQRVEVYFQHPDGQKFDLLLSACPLEILQNSEMLLEQGNRINPEFNYTIDTHANILPPHPICTIKGCVVTLTDITPRKQAERDLQRSKAELEVRVAERTAQLQQVNEHLMRELQERQKTEAALRISQARFAGILEIASDAIISVDINQNITLFNQGAEKIFGYRAVEVIGKPLELLLPERLRIAHREHVSNFSNSEGKARRMGERSEIFGRRQDGKEFVAEASISKLEVAGEISFTTFLRDISDIYDELRLRKRAEQVLRESEERFRHAFDYAAVGMALIAPDGRFLKVNHSYCQITGYSQAELLTINFPAITYPDDLELDLNYAHQLLRGEINSYHLEKRYIHKQGHIVWVLLSGSLIRDDQSQPLHFIAQVQDISDRKQSEQELELQAVITKNIAEGICLIRATDAVIVYANPKFERMFGYNSGELNGKHISIVNYTNKHISAEDINQAIRSQVFKYGEATYEVNNIKKDGTPFWCRATTSIFDHPQYGKVLVAVYQDITTQKQTEDLIKASLKEKEVLLKEIHHRVKNNLQIVSSLLQMQARRTQDSRTALVLRDSQNRIASIALVHEKLYRSEDLANIDFAQYIPDLTTHLFDTYNASSNIINLQINVDKIFLEIDTAIPCGLIINELVSNSIKYAFPDNRTGEIQIKFYPHNDHTLTLIVRDNGIGIPEEFDIETTNSLGLTLIQGLVEQLEGTLELDRSQGTSFKITFPGYIK